MKLNITTILIFLALVTSSFYMGYSRLTDFSGVDEPYWSYERVPNFWNALKSGQWKKTNICDKPGITLAAVSGLGLPFIDDNPKSFKSLRYERKTPEQLQQIRNIYFHLRLPVFLFTLMVLPLFYVLVKKLLGVTVARFSVLFVGFSPVLLGISLIINSDAMLWILTTLSVVSLFVFFKENTRKYLFLSGFFLGLSVITKYVANVLFVYFFLIFLLEYALYSHKDMPIGIYLKRALINYALLFATAIITAFAFFPATWVKLETLVNATVGNAVFSSIWPIFVGVIGFLAIDAVFLKAKFSVFLFDTLVSRRRLLVQSVGVVFLALATFVFAHVYGGATIFDLQAIIASPKGIGSGAIFYKYIGALSGDLYSLLFSISPLVLAALVFSVYTILRVRELSRESITIVYSILFIFIFYMGSAVNAVVTTVRYQIIVYPIIFIVAAIGMSRFFELEKVRKFIPLSLVYSATAIILFASLFLVKPNFLAYSSEILPDTFIVNLKGMGEGSFEAATFLNSLPGAHDLTIWSDKGAVCEAFVGRCFIDFKEKTFEQNKIDYFVVSTDRKSRTLKLSESIRKKVDFPKLYESVETVYEVTIDRNPNNFVKVISSNGFLINVP